MTTIELLKEARAELAKAHDHLMELTAKLPMQYFGLVDGNIIQSEDCFVDKIDAYLATPSESSMEVAEKMFPLMDEFYNNKLSQNVMLQRAAALIESCGRRVPRKMIEEIFNNAVNWALLGDPEQVDAIAAKYGVEVEG